MLAFKKKSSKNQVKRKEFSGNMHVESILFQTWFLAGKAGPQLRLEV